MTAMERLLAEGTDIEKVDIFVSKASNEVKEQIGKNNNLYFSKVEEWTKDNDSCDNINILD